MEGSSRASVGHGASYRNAWLVSLAIDLRSAEFYANMKNRETSYYEVNSKNSAQLPYMISLLNIIS